MNSKLLICFAAIIMVASLMHNCSAAVSCNDYTNCVGQTCTNAVMQCSMFDQECGKIYNAYENCWNTTTNPTCQAADTAAQQCNSNPDANYPCALSLECAEVCQPAGATSNSNWMTVYNCFNNCNNLCSASGQKKSLRGFFKEIMKAFNNNQ